MIKKNQNIYVSPEIKDLQAVVIDLRTKIFIPMDADPVEAKKKFLSRRGGKVF